MVNKVCRNSGVQVLYIEPLSRQSSDSLFRTSNSMDQGDIVRLSGVVSARLVFPAAAAAADVTGSIHLSAVLCEVRPYDGTLGDGDGIALTKFACALANIRIP